jgi:hypothetical protein
MSAASICLGFRRIFMSSASNCLSMCPGWGARQREKGGREREREGGSEERRKRERGEEGGW